ncbi:MAG TPA: hypothetical protein VH143_08210 [Kofleriaceae bacterium]|nr:hypothetical protein [Kofleriaceae bacterium]
MLAVLAVGCAIPADRHLIEVPTDATAGPLACASEPAPTTADPTIMIFGETVQPFTGDPVPGASITGYLDGLPGVAFTTTSDGSGAFSIDQATGGAPLRVHGLASADGYVSTMVYPSAPLIHATEIDPQLFGSDKLEYVASLAGLALDMTQDQIILQVVDCSGAPLGGATVTSDPPGTVVYFASSQPMPSAMMTDGTNAVVLIANVPPSSTEIYASVGETMFSTLAIEAAPGTLIQAAIQP